MTTTTLHAVRAWHEEMVARGVFAPNLQGCVLHLAKELGEVAWEACLADAGHDDTPAVLIAKLREHIEAGFYKRLDQPEADGSVVHATRERLAAELADMVILADSVAAAAGIELEEAVVAKLEENRGRDWLPPNAHGVVEHRR